MSRAEPDHRRLDAPGTRARFERWQWSGSAALVLVSALAGCAGTGLQVGADGGHGGASTVSGAGGSVSSSSGSGSGAAGGGPASTTSGAGDAGQNGSDAGTPPSFLPSPDEPCPPLHEGVVSFSTHGLSRDVQLWMSDAPAGAGPLVIFWHGTSRDPDQVEGILGKAVIDEILAAGGVIAAPFHDSAAAFGAFPWWLTTEPLPSREDDIFVGDQIVACALAQGRVDPKRLHTMGHSAGALQSVQYAYRRSGYLASGVPLSGGLLGAPPDQDPSNRFATLIFEGGTSDFEVLPFWLLSIQLHDHLKTEDRFSLLCDHGNGHEPPSGLGPGIWRFLRDHPFEVAPEPYAKKLPPEIPAYCQY